MNSPGRAAQAGGGLGAKLPRTAVEDIFGEARGVVRDQDDLCSGRNPASRAGSVRIEEPPLRILLADDTFVYRRIGELILKYQGYQVVTATDGEEAVRLAEVGSWDVIVMDLQMPVMNGWQAARAIRHNEKVTGQTSPVPIMALSAYTAPGNRQRCLQAGMDDFLTKPIEPEKWVERIERLARRSRT